ncbi:choice-of-anchor D domain-containing protein [Winogradskyella poriferorum]|uniref:choice-of-anchor D domain-containing protein n=1 Tax=Winogradskyella poriferorum TaxID=307627 RepID=UPI003D65EB39
MKTKTFPCKNDLLNTIKWYLVVAMTILSFNLNSQNSEFKVQHLKDEVANTGGTNTEFSEISAMEAAFVLPNSNRKSHAGSAYFSGTLHSDDLSGARVLTDIETLTYYRQNGSTNYDMSFNSSILEYIGPDGGANEFIVRGRYQVALNGSTNSTTQSLLSISNANKCIPFITGILSSDTTNGADSGTAIAYLEDATTLRVEKGTNASNVTVFVTVVEFTGSNWTVLHGDSDDVSADTGSISLSEASDGDGSSSNVIAWSKSIIFGQHRGDDNVSGVNQAIADNWPLFLEGDDDQTVDWEFNSNHDSNGNNRHFVHVLSHNDLKVTRYDLNSNSAGETDFDISSANLNSIDEALIIGSSISSGNGTAYARGWRNYHLKSTTQASHWAHRSGNTMTHEIQIVDLSAIGSNNDGGGSDYCDAYGNTSYDTGITQVTFNTLSNADGSPKDNGYEDFTSTHSTTVQRNTTRSLSVNVDTDGFYAVHVIAWIDWNQDYDFEDDGERYDLGTAVDVSDGSTDLSPFAITIPSTATIGATRLRIAAKFGLDPESCESDFDGEVEDYEIIVSDAPTGAEISISGNGFEIEDGDSTPSLLNHTDYGDISSNSGVGTKVFTIENLGSSGTLTLTGTSPFITISGADASDFNVSTIPSNTINALGSTTFAIAFTPSSEGLKTANISIANDDADENPYNFTIQGTGSDASYCESSGNLDYDTSVTNVSFNTINHSDGAPKDVGYEDFTNSHSTTVDIGATHDLSVKVDTDGNYTVHAFAWIDWNRDYDFDDDGESYDLGSVSNVSDGLTSLSPLAITVPESAQPGTTRMRVAAKYWSDPSSCETDFDGEVEDYGIIISAPAVAEISITGNTTEIEDGDTSTSTSNNTDFGSVNINETASKTYTIENTGTIDLEISNITLSNYSEFSLNGITLPLTINPSTSSTFDINFSSSEIGEKTTLVTIENNDADESSFQFTVKATAVQNFFDSDGDGIYDNIDIDDDNDGISDTVEESQCNNTGIAIKSNYKFLFETFGTGERTTINTNYNAITTYCFEDGTSSCSSGGIDLNDGEYTVYYRAADGDGVNDTPNEEVGSWADNYWYLGEDHTPDDTNGRMAMFNASYDPGIFYTANITGALPNIPITYSFWVINLDRTDAPGIDSRLRPDILVEFRDVDNNLLASITTDKLPPTTAGNLQGDWYNFSADLTFAVSEFNVYFYNNETGGLGNDLAIDDIMISQTLCDTDGDDVANVFDLDSDNDGIPDVVESGYSPVSNGKALIDAWVDNNSNGMHDAFEGLSPADSDSDGTPNYLDLDSDNDTIFDVDESGAGNTSDLTFENGDGDIDGDGVGDGVDSDAVREKDYNSDGTTEFYPDGILDIYDFNSGTTFATAYGNQGQGTDHSLLVKDSDNDGTPDYIDIFNNSTNTYDIANTLYASLDSNNDGLIDDTLDSEGDGILDLFDTADDTFWISERTK